MRNRLPLIPLLLLPMLLAAPPTGYVHWSAASLRSYDQKFGGEKMKNESLGTFPQHNALIVHREADGQAELHETDADLMVIQTGSGTLLVGGTIPDAKPTDPGEVRGSKIDGATKQDLAPGDIIHIPARTPHQLLVAKGQKLTYFTLKIKGQ